MSVVSLAERPHTDEQVEPTERRACSRRSGKVTLLLREREVERFKRAVEESGAMCAGFLVAEAVQAGLGRLDARKVRGWRRFRLDVRVPIELAEKIRERAGACGVSQAALVRFLLFRYIRAAPWRVWRATDPRHESEQHAGEVVDE